jgi:hypothetical protein
MCSQYGPELQIQYDERSSDHRFQRKGTVANDQVMPVGLLFGPMLKEICEQPRRSSRFEAAELIPLGRQGVH